MGTHRPRWLSGVREVVRDQWRIDLGTVTPGLAGRVEDATLHPEILGSDLCPVSVTV
jgi:exonuclease III